MEIQVERKKRGDFVMTSSEIFFCANNTCFTQPKPHTSTREIPKYTVKSNILVDPTSDFTASEIKYFSDTIGLNIVKI